MALKAIGSIDGVDDGLPRTPRKPSDTRRTCLFSDSLPTKDSLKYNQRVIEFSFFFEDIFGSLAVPLCQELAYTIHAKNVSEGVVCREPPDSFPTSHHNVFYGRNLYIPQYYFLWSRT